MSKHRAISWFKIGTPWQATINYSYGSVNNIKKKLTVWSYDNDRRDAVNEIVKEALRYGYKNITIDHMSKWR